MADLRRASLRTCTIATMLVLAACSPAPEAGGGDARDGSPFPDAAVRSALSATCLSPSAPVLNEVFRDALPARQWIEIHNPSAEAIALDAAWGLGDSAGQYFPFDPPLALGPGGFAVLCADASPAANGGIPCDAALPGLDLGGPDGGSVALFQGGTIVDQVQWPAPRPTGASAALRSPLLPNGQIDVPVDPDDPAAWTGRPWGLSTTPTGAVRGTPGATNADVSVPLDDPACDDGNPCTWDQCIAGACDHGLLRPGCCAGAGDCDDADPCTSDGCLDGACTHDAIAGCCTDTPQCDDGNPCTMDLCLSGRCRHGTVANCCGAPADLDPTTGLPWAPGERQARADRQCQDSNACTTDTCDLATGVCSRSFSAGCCVNGEQCADGNPCTLDLCQWNTCVHVNLFNCCATDAACDDGDPCTDDQCVISGCRHFPSSSCCHADEDCKASDDGNPCTREVCRPDPVTALRTCQHELQTDCVVALPFVERFDRADLATSGWKTLDGGAPAGDHWGIASTGDLAGNPHGQFSWNPAVAGVRSALVSPRIDASPSLSEQFNLTGNTTVQWRMSYRHALAGQPVTLRVVGTYTGDPLNGYDLWSRTLDTDLPYALFSAQLPGELKGSPTLRLGFVVDTGTRATSVLDRWEVDDVKVAAGVPNQLQRSVLYRCPATGECPPAPSAQVGRWTGAPPEVTVEVCQRRRLYLCYQDLDAYYSTWNFYGFPRASVDGPPLDAPAFLHPATDVGQGGSGCETLKVAVQSVCGPATGKDEGRYYCAFDLDPRCDEDQAGRYRPGLVSQDESDPLKAPHSLLESQAIFPVNALIHDGYIVWSPLGWTDPGALAIRDAIRTQGRRAQVVKDLSIVEDLAQYRGVFAVLGVTGRSYTLPSLDADRLKAYLDGGGRVYLEGGDFFWAPDGQPVTSLHPAFHATALWGGTAVAGSATGMGLWKGLTLPTLADGRWNAFVDRLAPLPGGREELRTGTVTPAALAVAYDSGRFRTWASALPFNALDPAGGQPQEAMRRLLNFFENGWNRCATVADCDDGDPCTRDQCVSTSCVWSPIGGCKRCVDDARQPGGGAGCGTDQACIVAQRVCANIAPANWGGVVRTDSGPIGQIYGTADSPRLELPVTVTARGWVRDIAVKVRSLHGYRGDVRLSLRGPDGRMVVLREVDVTDGARDVYQTYAQGVAMPAGQSMSVFAGMKLAGTWTLVVEDADLWLHNGLLEGWTLYQGLTRPCVTEVCNRYDDDCDEEIDEGVTPRFYRDADGDGHGVPGIFVDACSAPAGYVLDSTDFLDTDATVYPDAPELCDNKDNDGDGLTDEDIGPRSCYPGPTEAGGVGACRKGSQTCVLGAGEWTPCAGYVLPEPESCNGVDDDCNGSTDDGSLCPDDGNPCTDDGCFAGVCGNAPNSWSEACYDGPDGTLGVGACAAGVRSCREGTLGTCEGQVLPGPDTCNGTDDDCNGLADDASVCPDDGNPCTDDVCAAGACGVPNAWVEACYGGPDGTLGVGTCAAGLRACSEGLFGACLGEIVPVPEACNGADDDCNGLTDDGLECPPGG